MKFDLLNEEFGFGFCYDHKYYWVSNKHDLNIGKVTYDNKDICSIVNEVLNYIDKIFDGIDDYNIRRKGKMKYPSLLHYKYNGHDLDICIGYDCIVVENIDIRKFLF